jgi:siroheme synthase-like protein
VLPLAFKLEGQRVLVLGCGVIGARKATQLVSYGALVDVISEEFLAEVPVGVSTCVQRRYQEGDLDGYVLVISAVNDAETNEAIVDEARRRGIWLNVVDVPALCNFYFMALHTTGDVTVAVTSRGAAPALAQVVRDDIAAKLPSNLAEVTSLIKNERQALHDRGESSENIDWRPRIKKLLGLGS